MDIDDQDKDNSPPKISIPAINLNINIDYSLTLQEINRNFPNTENKYDRGYIRIQPHSLDDRSKIIELLNQNEKQYVLSEAPEIRPFKIVIKDVPLDHSMEQIY
ncbi:hypothetical protein AVEN_112678-1 [Araneus ventricosus]|uniref:Pre-C2HC domain-containing protein n=1 Tax=Araneus ventricosus TaxID=182803 RepID=A0A4Y2UD83_ARAVE|nr:hypothetical protein AVEN_112678-1 [Araneus ventricosus]